MSSANPGDEQRLTGRQIDPHVLRFLSHLAHELRTPLTGIKGSIGVVMANEPSGTSDPLRRMFRTIDAASDRMEHMIGNISELVRMQGGQTELLREECDLADLIRKVIDQTAADGQLRGLPVELEAPPEPMFAQVDLARTERAVRNLLLAAVKLLGVEGSISVTLASARSSDALPSEPARVMIAVAAELPGPQNGQGALPPLDRAASEERISLELAVVLAIAQRHGGYVAVTSTSSGGMALRFVVPMQTPAPAVGASNNTRAIGA